jgi:hypothetical protein
MFGDWREASASCTRGWPHETTDGLKQQLSRPGLRFRGEISRREIRNAPKARGAALPDGVNSPS